ncbi:hypothetical protein TRIP_D170017 [uncultured Paludibacter sp.]|nr:hypothetical protein TRIP_D170017 [uncultured Paludibacter sp.]
MDKNKRIKTIFAFVKGEEYNPVLYIRNWIVENGILVLKSEVAIDRPDNTNVPAIDGMIYIFDRTPVYMYRSDVENSAFKPTLGFFNKNKIAYTDEFANEMKDNSNSKNAENIIAFEKNTNCKTDFAYCESEVKD